MEVKITVEEFEKALLEYVNAIRKKLRLKVTKVVPKYKGRTLDAIVKEAITDCEDAKISYAADSSVEIKFKVKEMSLSVKNAFIKRFKLGKELKDEGSYCPSVYDYKKIVYIYLELPEIENIDKVVALIDARLV